jgi:putative phosphoribosyl transferase
MPRRLSTLAGRRAHQRDVRARAYPAERLPSARRRAALGIVLLTDRREAGRRLAERLTHLAGPDVVVLGLPRGGVPVAAEVAEALGAPLDVMLVRKLGVPHEPELAMGAIGEGGVRVVDDRIVRATGTSDAQLAAVEEREQRELERRAHAYRAGRSPARLAGRTALVVDDGLATGSTARAACLVARAAGVARIIVAVPVAPRGWTDRLSDIAEDMITLGTPRDFLGIGQFYADFTQTTDTEVVACLDAAARRFDRHGRPIGTAGPVSGSGAGIEDLDVVVEAGPVRLDGSLTVPEHAPGIVVFAHGGGSSRMSPRNRFVAAELNRAGLATLLFDLLTEDEAADRGNVFDVALLAGRLGAATRWLGTRPETRDLAVGYFGASTGAAAALIAAAELSGGAAAEAGAGAGSGARASGGAGPAGSAAATPQPVRAVVSRGGRPDLAGPYLAAVTAPTLLVVGGADGAVLELNREARERLGGPSELSVVPRATHLFEEPGALETVAELAAAWFADHLAATAGSRRPTMEG